MKSKMFVCAVIFGTFAGSGANSGGEKQPKAGAAAESRSGSPVQGGGGDDLAKLAKANLDAAENAYKAWLKPRNLGWIREQPISVMTYHLSVRWLNAELELTNKKEERIAAYGRHLQRMNDWEKAWMKHAGEGSFNFDLISSYQKEAEYWLAKERSAKK